MLNLVRKIVAGPKNRTVEGQYDLDLTHITDRIIAMAFPASGIQKTYRNSIDDVAAYLDKQFKGHYMVFNLSMRKYRYQKFQNRVKDYYWPDHQAPPVSVLFYIMSDMYQYLSQDPKNIIVVHCNHGKGRTGTAIVSLFLFTGFYKKPQVALKYYNKKRFSTHKYGVDQPCQMRYLNYVSSLLRKKQQLSSRLKSYRLVNFRQNGLGQDYFLRITSVRTQQKKYDSLYFPLKYKPANVPIMSDIFIQIYQPTIMGSKQLCRINYNLFFLQKQIQMSEKQKQKQKQNQKQMKLQNSQQKSIFSVQFKGQQIKVNDKNSTNFKFQLDFALYCQCHEIPQNQQLDTDCGCFSDRKFEDKAWQSVKTIVKKAEKIKQNKAIQILFGNLAQNQLKDIGQIDLE